MKKINLLMLLAVGSLLASCGKTTSTDKSTSSGEDTAPTSGETTNTESTSSGEEDTRPVYEKGEQKDVNGTGLLFSESVGFNTKDATVFEENDERYVIYCSNETAKGEQVFAARKGTLTDGKWHYGEKNIILRGAGDEAWDSYIYQPSVVKGQYSYGGESYSYLMAYQGNEDGSNYNNHIGLAVSNNVLGEWVRVGDEPILENPEIFESSFGYGSPSLISLNVGGRAMLSYSFGETQLSGVRVKTCDFSNLDAIVIEAGYAEVPTAGLTGRDDGILTNCDVAYCDDASDPHIFIANDGMQSANRPGCATSFEVAVGDVGVISSATARWESIERVTGFKTMDEDNPESLGWDELYSPAFVTNEYGWIDSNAEKIEVIYSTYNEGVVDSGYTAQLCSYTIYAK